MRGNFVLLRAGALRLVLPQDDVGAAHHIEPGDAADCKALAETMKLLPQRPADRFIAAEFTGDQAGLTWCWDELRVLIDAEFEAILVPQALMAPDTPVQAYVEVDGELAYLCNAANLCRYALAQGA